MQAKGPQCSGAEGEVLFRLVEKKTFLEYVPNEPHEVSFIRRSPSLPVLLGLGSKQMLEERLGAGGEKGEKVSKPLKRVRIFLPADLYEYTESDSSSPGATSLQGSCAEAWPLASTRGSSDQSLRTCSSAMSTPCSWSSTELDHHSTDCSESDDTSAVHSIQGTTATSSDDEVPLLPSVSVGSVLHEARLCRPCAWYWRPGGCTRGAKCFHCHLCRHGELAKRKYENRQLVKLRKMQSKENQSADH